MTARSASGVERVARGFVRRGSLALLALLLAVAGCDDVELISGDEARVRIAGSEGQVRIEVSLDFIDRIEEGEGGAPVHVIELLTADTIWVETPFDERWDIRGNRRFHVRAFESDPADASVTMHVWIDDREQFRATRVVTQNELRYTFIL